MRCLKKSPWKKFFPGSIIYSHVCISSTQISSDIPKLMYGLSWRFPTLPIGIFLSSISKKIIKSAQNIISISQRLIWEHQDQACYDQVFFHPFITLFSTHLKTNLGGHYQWPYPQYLFITTYYLFDHWNKDQ